MFSIVAMLESMLIDHLIIPAAFRFSDKRVLVFDNYKFDLHVARLLYDLNIEIRRL